ncbi:hypothetical protein PAXRUDRAFT_133465, partial [Paxillus rubicundulus Ve08.2h10]
KFATYWVAACISLHAFAVHCEHKGKKSDDQDQVDQFILEGLTSSEDNHGAAEVGHTGGRSSRLQAARAQQEQLKCRLFQAKDHRQGHNSLYSSSE